MTFTVNIAAVLGFIATIVVGVIGGLLRKTVFARLDQHDEEFKQLWEKKMEKAECMREMASSNTNMQEVKDLTKDNNKLLSKMAIDIAVVKVKLRITDDKE